MEKLLSIHYLRGIAALGVLLFHTGGFVAGYGNGWASADFLRIGEAGVDIFFVISGFILTVATQKPTSGGAFMLGRFARVGVPYWCILMALAAMTLILPAAFRSFSWAGSDLALSFAFIPSMLRDGSIFPLLEPGWTLCLEMLFYVLLAVSLSLAPNSRSALICAVLAGLALLGFYLELPRGQSIGWFFTQPILLEFCLGIAIAHLYLGGLRLGGGAAAMLIAAGVMALCVIAADPPEAFEPSRTLLYGLPAMAVVMGAVLLESGGFWIESAALSFLGTISYSLYLTHVLSLAVMAKLFGGRIPGLAGDLVLALAAIAGALIAAYVFYRIVERPALAIGKRLQAKRRDSAAALSDGEVRPQYQPG